MKQIFKNSMVALVMVGGLLAVPMITPRIASAAQICSAGEDNTTVLGFPAWYRGLCGKDLQGEPVGELILIVAMNVVDIMLRLISLVAVGFIIYGGVLYLIARGEPANIAKAKSTIIRAVAGLIIGIASSAIVGFIVGRIS